MRCLLQIAAGCAVVILAGCSGVQPHVIDPVADATRDMIWTRSWELEAPKKPVAERARGGKIALPVDAQAFGGLRQIEVINTADAPIIFDFYPWWEVDAIAGQPTRSVDPESLPEASIPPGESRIIRILYPAFFREGACIVISRKMTEAEIALLGNEAEQYTAYGWMPYIAEGGHRISADELRGRGIVRITFDPIKGVSRQARTAGGAPRPDSRSGGAVSE